MHERYVVDTNVLIAASAADPAHPKDIDATPQDADLRMEVWRWLSAFKDSPCQLVLDIEGRIFQEYRNKLGFNDFGIQVVMDKWSRCQVSDVSVSYDEHGHGILPSTLQPTIHDLADRKMVAACLGAIELYNGCMIAFAGDTDWHEWEVALQEHGVELEPIIEAWPRQRYEDKQERQ